MDVVVEPQARRGIDLHCHSTASDGRLTPTQLVEAAAEAGVGMLALTDHDTLDGLAEAQQAALACDITLVTGVEISVRWQQRTLHVVGLDIDVNTAAMRNGLALMQQQRRLRAVAIAAKLERLGLSDALNRASAQASGGQITRTHYARLLVESGMCKTMQQAFKHYLASGKPAYAAAQWVPMAEAVSWIVDAGGSAVLAHPLQYRLGTDARTRLLKDFRQAGGSALEVCSGNSRDADVMLCAADARCHQLLGSVGSDFHGPEQRWLKLGGAPPLPASITPVWTRFATSLKATHEQMNRE